MRRVRGNGTRAPTDRSVDVVAQDGEDLRWRTASQAGSCVEVAFAGAGAAILVRDSKDRGGSTLEFTVQEWNVFLAGVRKGMFNVDSLAPSR